MNPTEAQDRICIVDDCYRIKKSTTYCNMHWIRFRKTGNTDAPKRRLKYGKSVRNMYEYQCWKRMKVRCYNKNFPKYPIYGGRGIRVCERWKNNFEAFLDDMGERPDSSYSLDRINVNGNYEPTNCRWASKTIQARNQRIRKDNTSGYRGVYVTKAQTYRVLIQVNKKTKINRYF